MQTPREQLFSLFEKLGIKTNTIEHEAAHTVSQSKQLRGDIPGGHTKNLFLKSKDSTFWLVVAIEDTQVDLKALAKKTNAKRFSFAKPENLLEKMGITPGSVTPFALINNTQKDITVILDKKLVETEILNFHPLENTATTSISSDDLLKFIAHTQHNLLIHELDA